MHVLAERLVPRMLGEDVEGTFHVLGERPWQHLLELLEGGREIGVVFVGVADHQPRGQHHGHRLVEGQLQRWQELLADDAPQPALGPHRDADLFLQRPQVAVDGPGRDADATGDLRWADPIGVTAQDGDDAEHPREPVTLAEALGLVPEGHGAGGWMTGPLPRSVAVRKTSMVAWTASGRMAPA